MYSTTYSKNTSVTSGERVAGRCGGGAVSLLLKALPALKINSLFLMPHAKAIKYATGIPMDTGSFVRWGERGYNLERMYSLREGLTGADDSLPDRLTRVPQVESRPDTVVPMDKMLPKYYKIRGWDPSGIPTDKTLRKLGLI